MPQIGIETYEQYPAYTVVSHPNLTEDQSGLRLFEVAPETLNRWDRIAREHAQMHDEIDRLVNPRCPECDHPQTRHQQWSAGWGRWGCLHKITTDTGTPEEQTRTCGCQHGKPANS